MIGSSKKLLQAAAGAAGGELLAIEDVFSTYLYTGNDSTQTITNGIDLAGEGGLIWTKARTSSSRSHYLVDTERPINRTLTTNTNDPQQASSGVTSITSTGYTLDSNAYFNTGTFPYVSWTFRKAPRFFDVVTYTGDGNEPSAWINHNLGVLPGCIIIKRTDSTGDWYAYHRSLSNRYGNLLLNSTTSELTNFVFDDSTNGITDTQFRVFFGGSNLANINGATYVAYLFAHDPLGPSGDGSDGLIACGSLSLTTGNVTSVDLGWEPQWLLVKKVSSTQNWQLFDNMRGFLYGFDGTNSRVLNPNTTAVESNLQASPLSDGFALDANNWGAGDYIYIAIRRGPMRQPTSGTEVFALDYQTTGAPNYTSGFVTDAALRMYRTGGSSSYQMMSSRLTGGYYLTTSSTSAEVALSSWQWDFMDGYGDNIGGTSTVVISPMFRRAPGFFDVVAYTGNGVAGRTVSHNLGVAPELMIVKSRSVSASNWLVYNSTIGATNSLYLNLTLGSDPNSFVNNTDPTDTVFSLGTSTYANGSGSTYIAYLFATLPGISKVGSYTGNGSSQTINCGFTGGARFVLIKRTDSTGDWYVWDTARGIVSGNDPHLSLNTTAAEVTTDDSIDPASSGFIVNQVSATNVNVSSASYIYLAIA